MYQKFDALASTKYQKTLAGSEVQSADSAASRGQMGGYIEIHTECRHEVS